MPLCMSINELNVILEEFHDENKMSFVDKEIKFDISIDRMNLINIT